MKIRRVPIDVVHLDPANARLHGEENMAAITGSLNRFGQVEPLVIQKRSGRIIGGNGRIVAMKQLGWTECDIVELDVDDVTATALGIALNRSAELGAWNEEALLRTLQLLEAEKALDGVGYSPDEIDSLLDLLEDRVGADLEDPGPGELPENPVTQLGDLWILGEQKLHCGDSTKPDDVARVLAGERASLLATDPPYLVDYDGMNHPKEHHIKAGRRGSSAAGGKRWDEYRDPQTSVEFYTAFLRAALPHCIERVPVYQWHASKRQALVEQAWTANTLLVHQQIVWRKARGILTRSMFLWQHEPCLFGWPEGHMPEKQRRPPTNETTVWEIDQVGESGLGHPTVKPVLIFERPIAWHTKKGEVVLEPFSGSGTQIIAAEKLGRRCRAIEISPAFVDVAVRRWEGATRRKAILDGSERKTFDAVAAERAAATPPPRSRAKARA